MARLALVEKGQSFERRQIDIMHTHEQFEAWYIALNPRAVVPTLQIDGEIVTETITIVNRVNTLAGPDLDTSDSTQAWLRDIMALHYGVLMYRKRLEADGTAPQIVARGRYLSELQLKRPDLRRLIDERLARNARFQALLKDPPAIEQHLSATRQLVNRMANALANHRYLAGESYSLADCFATAALARFTIHGFDRWWADTPVSDYYRRMMSRPSFVQADVVGEGTERDL